MGHSNIWNSHPKNYGPGSRTCRVHGNPHGIIREYGLMCCRQCFRSNAKEISSSPFLLNARKLFFRKAYFVGLGERIKPRLFQALTKSARPDSKSRPAAQITSSLLSRHAPWDF